MESFWRRIFHQSIMPSKMFYYLITLYRIEKYTRSVGNNKRRNRNYAGFIRQYVALSSLNLDSFNKSLEAFAKVHCSFGDLLPADKLESLPTVSIDGFAALRCHTMTHQRTIYPQENTHKPTHRRATA